MRQVTSHSKPIVGDEITLTATITDDTPTGTVEFSDGTTSLGTAPVSGGQAQLATDTLTAGVRSINAVYSGDAENTPATTGSTTVTVRSTAGTSVVVDDDTPVLGDEVGSDVTLTATVEGVRRRARSSSSWRTPPSSRGCSSSSAKAATPSVRLHWSTVSPPLSWTHCRSA